jgi:hypothetical protein
MADSVETIQLQERLQSEIDCLEQCSERILKLAADIPEQQNDLNLGARSAKSAAKYLKLVLQNMRYGSR